jgi:hypothetical protein
MKRISKVLAVVAVFAASVPGLALAASSPTVATGSVVDVTGTTAVLRGVVDPNANTTDYLFDYGLTDVYGVDTPSRLAGHGTKAVDVTQAITGLTPGTTYHYRIAALNKSGTAYGTDRTFTTTGHPPAGVVTGSAVDVGKTVATATGSINPEGAPTSYVVQYGLTTSYGVQTFPLILAAVDTPLPVTVPLSGLASATLFHYRIVAYHGASVASAGADQTFFTEPLDRPKPDLSTRTSPSLSKRSPYTFTTAGTLRGAGFIPAPQRCTGNVGIRYYNGHHQLAFVVAPVAADCKFSVQATFTRLFGHGPVAVKVAIDFRGNGYLLSVNRTDHVTAG